MINKNKPNYLIEGKKYLLDNEVVVLLEKINTFSCKIKDSKNNIKSTNINFLLNAY